MSAACSDWPGACQHTPAHDNGRLTPEPQSALSIGALKEGIINATELDGVFGQNVHESKDVVLRIDGKYYPLTQVSVGFLSQTGRITMFLEGGEPL